MTTPTTAIRPDRRQCLDVDARLDDIIATPDQRSRHVRHVAAAPERVWEALLTVSIDAHPVVRLLTAARNAPRRLHAREIVAWPRRRRTLLEMAPYPLVAVDPGRGVIMAGVAQPWRLTRAVPSPQLDLAQLRNFDAPGWVKVAMDIRIAPHADGATISTETRVWATDAAARRAFACYWTIIRLPSALLRRIMLATLAADAERTS